MVSTSAVLKQRSRELDALEAEVVKLTARLVTARRAYCEAFNADRGLVRDETVLVAPTGKRYLFSNTQFQFGRITLWATPINKDGSPSKAGPRRLYSWPQAYTVEGAE